MTHDTTTGWMQDAACRGFPNPEIFFPEQGKSAKPAKAICETCPVRDECLDHAIFHRQKDGVWGGLNERERRPLRKISAEGLDRKICHKCAQQFFSAQARSWVCNRCMSQSAESRRRLQAERA